MKKILMGSLVLTVLAAAIVTVQMSSCTKTTAQTNACPTATYPITGLWVGSFTIDSIYNIPGVFDYSFAIYPDGTFVTRSKQSSGTYFGSGTWSLSSDSIFTATSVSFPTSIDPTPVTQVFQAKFSNTGVLNGANRDSINVNGIPLSYKFNLTRIN